MSDPVNNSRIEAYQLHEALRGKCSELLTRTALLIEQAAAGDSYALTTALIDQSAKAVEFWTDEIVKMVAK